MIFDYIRKHENIARIEFWVASTFFVFMVFFFIVGNTDSTVLDSGPYYDDFVKAKVPYSHYKNFFIPVLTQQITIFAAFLYLNFIVVPKIVKRQALLKNLLFVLLSSVILGAIIGFSKTYLQGFMYAARPREVVTPDILLDAYLQVVTLYLIFGIYCLIKYVGVYFLIKIDAIHNRFPYITRESIVCIILWLIALLVLWIAGADYQFTVGWAVIIPQAIAFYSFAFYRLIPKVNVKKHSLVRFLLWSSLIIALAFFPVAFLFLFLFVGTPDSESTAFNLSAFNTVFQAFITVPVTWLIYKYQQKGNEEVIVLKKELRQSTANIDFLRSQINPHFLFNALNTLYGTAIQENAERTSEGVQKLGDMMRFMLRENMQEKISLSREIDYLENYIGLQRLRTDNNPAIQIQTNIDSRPTMFQIAPMLLIPFVENAFKHGISFREPSYIKVTLEIKDKTLYFDVHNSKHERNTKDPEKDKSGIGLENVRQRLKLLYPGRHELSIRDNPKEFFIHLTIQLA
jgi:two-component system, LytTR family, sensor kinase